MSEIKIIVKCNKFQKLYSAKVFPDICVGEFIRNCCVNLGIEPDTINGITVNVQVGFNQTLNWKYNPALSLKDCGFFDGSIIEIDELIK